MLENSEAFFFLQADGTAWMAFFAISMLGIALELAVNDSSYEDMASKFFEHFIAIVDAMNQLSGFGLWNEEDGFYYDHIRVGNHSVPLKVRSMVGLVPLFSCHVLEDEVIQKLPGFKKRLDWFLKNRQDLASQVGRLYFSIFSAFSLNFLPSSIFVRNVPLISRHQGWPTCQRRRATIFHVLLQRVT